MAAPTGDLGSNCPKPTAADNQPDTPPERPSSEHPDWQEIADALYLASVIGSVPEEDRSATARTRAKEPLRRHPTPSSADQDQRAKQPDTSEAQLPEPATRPAVMHHGAAGQHARSKPVVVGESGNEQLDVIGIVRALRPLRRKARSRRLDDVVLDEEATAEQAVRGGPWLPVVQQATERWLDLTLVVDTGPSMALWREKINAFERLLRQTGTFRTTQRLLLSTTNENAIELRGTTGASVRTPAELLDPSGRRIVLMLTDGVGKIWRSPQMSATLARLARTMPTAVIHLLPQRFWRQMGFAALRATLKPGGRLVPNCRWSMALPDVWLDFTRDDAVPVPVVEMRPRLLERIVDLFVGRDKRIDSAVYLASSSDTGDPESELVSYSAREQVNYFRSTVPRETFRLATLLAAVPFSLEAARRIQVVMVPEAGAEHIAQLLGSPFIGAVPVPHVDFESPWSTVSFDIGQEVRKELISSARRSETARVVRLTTPPYSAVWKAFDQPDVAPDPSVLSVTADEIAIEKIVMDALSGPYLSRAGRLGKAVENVEPTGIRSNGTNMPQTVGPAAINPQPGAESPPAAVSPSPTAGAAVTSNGPDVPLVSSHPGPALLEWSPPSSVRRQPGESPRVWGSIPPRNPNFTGRVDLLHALGDRLKSDGFTAVLPSALHGMGGIGKTQIAVEYIYQHLSDYDLVWWVEAANPTHIRTSLTELAKVLDLPGAAEANMAVPAVREALRLWTTGKWLLVFDAAETPESVQPFFPTSGTGDILITSRNTDWANVARPLEVATFQRGESVELLRRRGPEIEDGDANRLAETLGDLPLAIEQAAAWRAETGMSVEEYLRLFDSKVAEILDTSAPTSYDLSVAAAWNVSFDALYDRNPAAHQLLQICAFFSPEPIPRYFFTGIRNVSIAPELDQALRDPMVLARAIRDINRYSLAKINHRNGTIQLHRLVQLVLRNRMAPQQLETMKHGAHVLLANLDPNDPTSQKHWSRYQDLRPHAYASDITDCDDGWARQVIINLMRFLFRWGDHEEAMNLAEYAVERWKAAPSLGDEDKQTLEASRLLGYYYWIRGRFEEAADINAKVLEVRRRVDGENHEETLTALSALAGDRRTQGDFSGAAEISADVYNKAKALFDPDDPTALIFARSHCISLRLLGKYREAEELDRQTYEQMVVVLGPDHPQTISTWSGWILDRREGGDYLGARIEQEKLAERAREIHGENNADTLRRLAYLAVARRKAGDHIGALDLATDVLKRFQVRYGEDTFNYNATACALGRSIDLRHGGNLRQAKELGEQVVETYRERIGESHPYTKCAEIDLAVTLRLLGNSAQARAIDERALEQLRTSLGHDHVYSLIASINLASDLSALGETEAALALNNETLERCERVLGPDHPTTLAASLNTALDLRAQNRADDGDKRHTDVLSRYRRVLGDEHPATVNAAKGIRADCDVDPLPL
ncbi:Tetratricopeptide repeat-containing protein [Kibdelosporangium aridum]|uniref:Tetratricopeptide repeat-containing protein n=2 Tax=Kibdelosporangium aridum TaxID=2030 RepID=A0A1Y5Y8H9_KIBAR|nr:Tetratricopeptide repeat-containing protein [Kibdelosporangium aridum]